ncbi:uncharacterized protein [Malus domestica]|uniref:uncharacterized protein n=1 Tax=Malus domestica TaxID=3750 RepID=UPI00397524E5
MSMLDIYDVAVSLGYNHLQTGFHYKDKVKGFVPLIADADVSEFVSHIPSFRVQVLYLTNNGQWGNGWDNWFEKEVLATDLDNHLVDATVQREKGVNVEASVNQRVDVKIFDVDADDEYENENEDDEDVGDDDGAREESENDFEYVDSDYVQSENDTEVVKDDTLFERFVVDEAFEASYKEPGEISTDEYNSEELVRLDEEEHSDEEGIVVKKVRRKRKAPRFKQFRRETDLLNPTFYLGMEFPDMKACREAVRYYSVAISRPLHWDKNDRTRLRVSCLGTSKIKCPWLLYAAHVGRGPTTRIKTFVPEHTCGRLQKTKYATSSWLAERFEEELRDNPNMSVGWCIHEACEETLWYRHHREPSV